MKFFGDVFVLQCLYWKFNSDMGSFKVRIKVTSNISYRDRFGEALRARVQNA